MENKKLIGERLRLARQRKQLRQLDVAVALEDYDIKLDHSAVGKIERGERNFYVHELAALMEILDISADWVIKGGDLSI